MNKPSQASEECLELAQFLEQLAERAATNDSAELAALWPGVEDRVLSCVRADARGNANAAVGPATSRPQAEEQRLRNLAWEVAVSIDLGAVHVGAIRGLAGLLRERGQRSSRRSSSHGSNAHAAR
jgi:hypothetical protein